MTDHRDPRQSPPLALHMDTVGQGPDLLILHGLFGSIRNWQQQAGKLADHFRVHSLDLRNHGRSPHAAEMNYPLMADDIAATCEQHNLSLIHI